MAPGSAPPCGWTAECGVARSIAIFVALNDASIGVMVMFLIACMRDIDFYPFLPISAPGTRDRKSAFSWESNVVTK
jgi:hypothetical protein